MSARLWLPVPPRNRRLTPWPACWTCSLEQITCPTLVLHGRADGNVPFAHAQFVARTVPKVELIAIEDCGHLIWVGPHASQAREQVLAFLRQHAPPPANPPEQKGANLK